MPQKGLTQRICRTAPQAIGFSEPQHGGDQGHCYHNGSYGFWKVCESTMPLYVAVRVSLRYVTHGWHPETHLGNWPTG